MFSFSVYSTERHTISYGEVNIGDTRIRLQANDFKIQLQLKKNIPTKVVLKKGSIEWIRIEEVVLTPRGRVAIYFKGHAKNFSIHYRGKSINMMQENEFAYTEFHVSLFDTDKIKLFHKGVNIGFISFYAKSYAKVKDLKHKTQLIDYSCSRNDIKIKGLEGEYMTVGCRTHRVGKFGNEKPMLEVLWNSANYKLLDKSKAPYIAKFMSSRPVEIDVINQFNEIKTLSITARIPKRMHRLVTAYGFGPYAFETSFTSSEGDAREKYNEPMVPALMFYFNYKISTGTSIRGFDAAVWQKSTFNNAGIYLANDIAVVLDNKLTFTTLLGMQYLHFKFDADHASINEPLFPQGIEFLYKHAFDIENYIVSGGLFLSPSESVTYQNIWIRWGKNYFWELNYIAWGEAGFDAKMWGLSIGFPLAKFF